MSEKLFDYECPKHGAFEAWGSAGKNSRCPECGKSSKQMIGSRGILLKMNDEGFPRAYRMWEDWHRKEYIREGTLDSPVEG